MKPVRIAFGYKARSGKDEAATYLSERMERDGYKKPRHLFFAEPLYGILYHAQSVAGFPKGKDREFLQWVGTDWGRARDPDVWVKATLRNVGRSESVFITDVRFPNEAEGVREIDCILVRIDRPDRPDCRDHASETQMDSYTDWDYTIENDGTLEEFHAKLDKFYDNVVKPLFLDVT